MRRGGVITGQGWGRQPIGQHFAGIERRRRAHLPVLIEPARQLLAFRAHLCRWKALLNDAP